MAGRIGTAGTKKSGVRPDKNGVSGADLVGAGAATSGLGQGIYCFPKLPLQLGFAVDEFSADDLAGLVVTVVTPGQAGAKLLSD